MLWYQQVHPDDKGTLEQRSRGDVFSGTALRSAYRVMARDGRVIWFSLRSAPSPPGRRRAVVHSRRRVRHHRAQADAGGFAGRAQRCLGDFQYRRRIDHCAGPEGGSLRFNRACEQMTGYSVEESAARFVWVLCRAGGSRGVQKTIPPDSRQRNANQYESRWVARDGKQRILAWSAAVLPGTKQTPTYIIASGIDVTDQEAGEAEVQGIARSSARCGSGGQPERQIMLVNAQAEKLFGYRSGDHGEDIEKLVPERLRGKQGIEELSSRSRACGRWARASSYELT